MAIIKQYHADTDTTYVYSSEYYWDPEKKQSRSKRRVIGKIDPKTGEIVPTGKRGGRPKKSGSDNAGAELLTRTIASDNDQIPNQKDQIIRELKLALSEKEEQIRSLERLNSQYTAKLSKIQKQLEFCINSIGE